MTRRVVRYGRCFASCAGGRGIGMPLHFRLKQIPDLHETAHHDWFGRGRVLRSLAFGHADALKVAMQRGRIALMRLLA